MSDKITGRTRGGEEWVPEFVTELNAETCIGCGRCYKVCPRDVFNLVERGGQLAQAAAASCVWQFFGHTFAHATQPIQSSALAMVITIISSSSS